MTLTIIVVFFVVPLISVIVIYSQIALSISHQRRYHLDDRRPSTKSVELDQRQKSVFN